MLEIWSTRPPRLGRCLCAVVGVKKLTKWKPVDLGKLEDDDFLKLTAVIAISMYARNQLVANSVVPNKIIKAPAAITGATSGSRAGGSLVSDLELDICRTGVYRWDSMATIVATAVAFAVASAIKGEITYAINKATDHTAEEAAKRNRAMLELQEAQADYAKRKQAQVD
jgi:hypothetical protein